MECGLVENLIVYVFLLGCAFGMSLSNLFLVVEDATEMVTVDTLIDFVFELFCMYFISLLLNGMIKM